MALSKIRNDSLADTAVHGRRRININGAMAVAQRGTSASMPQSTNGYKSLDRWNVINSGGTGVFTVSQDSESPEGFSNSMKFQCTTADTSVTADERVDFTYRAEAQDLQHLKYGTSNAKSITLSFWVRSSLTGTYAVNAYQGDVTGNRTLVKSYTVNSADTWEYKTVTFEGDSSGQIDDDTGVGLYIHFGLVAGTNYTGGTLSGGWQDYSQSRFYSPHTVNLASSTSNNFYITGVQLEVGDTATPFEHRSYGEELALCRRYYQTIHAGAVAYGSATKVEGSIPRTPMRAAPSATVSAAIKIEDPAVTSYTQSSAAISLALSSVGGEKVILNNFSSLSSTKSYYIRPDGGSIQLDAEL